MKVYLDNMMVSALSGRTLGDSTEQAALDAVAKMGQQGKLSLLISSEVHREIDRTRNPETRGKLKEGASRLNKVEKDHRLLGFNVQDLGRYGFISSPLITDIPDEQMFTRLTTMGLKKSDAKHLMYALIDKCDIFLTTDPDFIDRRPELESIGHLIRIRKPSELLAELTEESHDPD